MATLPTYPSFAFQEVPTLTKLNQLAGAASFATQMPIVVSLKRNATQSISANTTTAVLWNLSEVDSDGMHSTVTNPSRLTSQTQGYYRVHVTIALSQTTTAAYTSVWFEQTTGVNNPLGSGHTQNLQTSAAQGGIITSDVHSYTLSGLTPCLYVGDYLEVNVFTNIASTLRYDLLYSGNADQAGNRDGSSCLTAMYVAQGP